MNGLLRDVRRALRTLKRSSGFAAVAIGCAAALIATRVMRAPLFDVSARDPLVFVSIAALLVAVALLACVVPALRAARLRRIDPLRSE
ncbi:MAG: hypothetical protein ABJC61_08700 [Acidobacteriota bacterium]